MTPECGRIDIEYVHCSYQSRIGQGKWMHATLLGSLYLTQVPDSLKCISNILTIVSIQSQLAPNCCNA